jgi:large subunit ribosomal protein L10
VVKNKLAARPPGHQDRGRAAGAQGRLVGCLYLGRSGALAKALSTWVKDNAEFTFKLGIVDGKVITVEEIGALATMPGKEELFSKLLFLIQSPAQRLATVINATGRDLAVVINQGVEKGKFAGAPPQLLLPRAEAEPPARSLAKAAPVEAPVQKPLRPLKLPARELAEACRARHVEEAPRASSLRARAAGERTASQAGEAAAPIRSKAHNKFRFIPFGCARVRLSGRNGNPAG